MDLILRSQNPIFFSLDTRGKTGVLKGYCRDKGPKIICWALGLVEDVGWSEDKYTVVKM